MTEIGLPFKVLLIVDNAPGHPCLKNPNIKVVFLPLNTTSLIQLLDQGIIATFKKHFVKLTFRCILENDAITLTEVWKKFLILDCINHAATAIAEIKRHSAEISILSMKMILSIQNETVSDSDIINYVTDPTNDQEDNPIL